MTETRDAWAAAATYEDFMGRWSRRLAVPFVRWLDVPRGAHWLDVGCGTGALAGAICEHADPASVTGCDPASPFIEFASGRRTDARMRFVVAGVGSLPRHAEGYGSVTSLLALNFFPDAGAALAEMRSLAAHNGAVSACVWDYAGRMEFLRFFWDAAIAVEPDAQRLDEGRRFPGCRPEALTELFRSAGLADVRCDPIEIPTPFASLEDYWRPFLGGTGPAPSYVASLDAERRSLLSRAVERILPVAQDGTIALVARAWTVRGTAS